MKQCKQCYKEINDNAKFCVYCGAQWEPEHEAGQPMAPHPPTQPVYTFDIKKILPTPAQAALSGDPTLNLLKKNASGLAYFVFLLLYSLFACVSLVTIFRSELPGMEFLNDILGNVGLSAAALKSSLPSLNTLTTLYRLIKALGMLPVILTCIGVWKFYLACKKPGNTVGRSNGLVLIEIPVILSFIGSGLGVLLTVVGGGVLAFAMEKGWIFLIALALCLATLFSLVYNGLLLRLITTAKNMLASSSPTRAVPCGWAIVVFNFINAARSLFFGTNGIFGNLLLAACIVTVTTCLIQYKNDIAASRNTPAMAK